MEVKEVVGPLRGGDGELVTDYAGMSKLLNNYFSSVFTIEDLNEKLPEVTNRFQGDDCCMLKDINLSREVIINKMKSLRDGKAPGIDGIVSKVTSCQDLLSVSARTVLVKFLCCFMLLYTCDVPLTASCG